MKFKRGNIVKFKCGFWGDPDSYETGRLGVISKHGDISGYQVLDKETGASSAWWNEEYLEFVSDGGEDEVEKCKEAARIRKERDSDLNYIKEKFVEFRESKSSNSIPIEFTLSTDSILKLFDEVGWDTSFKRNGEYLCLYSDWYKLYPLFTALFNKEYDTMLNLMWIFTDDYRDGYEKKFIALYEKVNGGNE